ncbi:hypothetical protein [Dysosmobacter sp.]|uniref:hypothetical protein n=1 Tax=Dysosmobacter sp. TaxID=2591382 RepID=UPI003AEFD744
MITFPTTVEAVVAHNGETVADLDATMMELLDYCVSVFNGAFYAGTKGEAPANIIKDAAEDYAQMGLQQDFEDPKIKCFYASLQRVYDEAWKQGAAKANRNGVRA